MSRLRIMLVAVLLALLAGCGSLAAAGELSATLSADGFASPGVNVSSTNGVDTVTVTSSGHPTLTGVPALERVGELVWTTFPRRFDRLEVTVGSDSDTVDRATLENVFNPRDPALDATTISSDFVGPLIGFAVGFLVFVIGIVLLIVLLVRRAGRRRREAGAAPGYPQQGYPPPGYPQAGPTQGYPQQGYPPPGYPQQGPQQGYPPAGQPQHGNPPAGQPQQGYPPAGQPQEGNPPAGPPQQGYPPAGQPQQGPPQGYPPQGKPPTPGN